MGGGIATAGTRKLRATRVGTQTRSSAPTIPTSTVVSTPTVPAQAKGAPARIVPGEAKLATVPKPSAAPPSREASPITVVAEARPVPTTAMERSEPDDGAQRTSQEGVRLTLDVASQDPPPLQDRQPAAEWNISTIEVSAEGSSDMRAQAPTWEDVTAVRYLRPEIASSSLAQGQPAVTGQAEIDEDKPGPVHVIEGNHVKELDDPNPPGSASLRESGSAGQAALAWTAAEPEREPARSQQAMREDVSAVRRVEPRISISSLAQPRALEPHTVDEGVAAPRPVRKADGGTPEPASSDTPRREWPDGKVSAIDGEPPSIALEPDKEASGTPDASRREDVREVRNIDFRIPAASIVQVPEPGPIKVTERVHPAAPPRWSPPPNAAEIGAEPDMPPTPSGNSEVRPSGEAAAIWHGPGRPLTVNGHDLRDGMVYTGTAAGHWGHFDDCVINPSLAISPRQAGPLDYWPSYTRIGPEGRNAYLGWLSTGRKEPGIDIGYVFLFFYGLERRLILDSPPEAEVSALLDELRRLRGLYGEHHSFDEASERLIDVASLMRGPPDTPYVPDPQADFRSMPLPLQVAVARDVAAKRPLQFDAAAMSLLSLREAWPLPYHVSGLGRVVFLQLFRLRFEKAYPSGFPLKTRRGHRLKVLYSGAMSGFNVDVGGPRPCDRLTRSQAFGLVEPVRPGQRGRGRRGAIRPDGGLPSRPRRLAPGADRLPGGNPGLSGARRAGLGTFACVTCHDTLRGTGNPRHRGQGRKMDDTPEEAGLRSIGGGGLRDGT